MRRLRLLSREEQLLRETVRGMLQEVDPETERLSSDLGISTPKKGDMVSAMSRVGVVSDVLGVLANFAGNHPFVKGLNISADIMSVGAAGYLMYDEWTRHGLAMEAVEMLRAENDSYHDVTGSYGHDVDDLNKFELYYDARAFCAAVQVLLGIAAAVPSVIQALGGNPMSMTSAAEIGLKVAKVAITSLTAADAEGHIDLAQSVTDTLSKIGKLWDKVSKTSQYAALIDKYGPEVLATFRDPKVKAAITVAASSTVQGGGLPLTKTAMDAADIIEKTLPKLKAA
jgi:hypothetical protein